MIKTKLHITFDTQSKIVITLVNPLLEEFEFNVEQLYTIYNTAYELGMFNFDSFLNERITEKLIYDIKEHFYKDQEVRLQQKHLTIDDIITKTHVDFV